MDRHVSDPKELGRTVRERRRAQGLGQEDLALAAGTGRRFISDVENGKPTARLGDVMRVLRTLGLRVVLRSPDSPDAGAQ